MISMICVNKLNIFVGIQTANNSVKLLSHQTNVKNLWLPPMGQTEGTIIIPQLVSTVRPRLVQIGIWYSLTMKVPSGYKTDFNISNATVAARLCTLKTENGTTSDFQRAIISLDFLQITCNVAILRPTQIAHQSRSLLVVTNGPSLIYKCKKYFCLLLIV